MTIEQNIHQFYSLFRLTPIGPVALVLALKNDFAAQAFVESDCCVFIWYTLSMFQHIFVLHASVFVAQGQRESHFYISMKYDF